MKNLLIILSFAFLIPDAGLAATVAGKDKVDEFTPYNYLDVFKNHYNLGFTVKPLLYRKAQVSETFGSTELINKHIPSYEIGIEYQFNSHKTWSFTSGFYIGMQPIYFMEFYIEDEDFYYIGADHNGADLSLVPISVEWKKFLQNELFWNIRGGVKIIDYPNNSTKRKLGNAVETPEEEYIFTELFYYELQYPATHVHGSVFLTTGLYFVLNKSILQVNVLYNKNLHTLLEGHYRFGTPPASYHSGGNYTLSGDFAGLSLTWFVKRFKVCKDCE